VGLIGHLQFSAALPNVPSVEHVCTLCQTSLAVVYYGQQFVQPAKLFDLSDYP
jgi:hypothetical protein